MRRQVVIYGYSILALCVVALLPLSVHAQAQGPFNGYFGGGGANVQLPGSQQQGADDSLINVVKGFINRGLSMLGLIALIMVLYGGFLMVTSAGSKEQNDKGRKVIQYAVVGLIFIGVSRFVLSLIFRFVNIITTGAGPAGTGG